MLDELNVHNHVRAEAGARSHILPLVILSSSRDVRLTAGNNMIRGISGGQRKRVTTGAANRCRGSQPDAVCTSVMPNPLTRTKQRHASPAGEMVVGAKKTLFLVSTCCWSHVQCVALPDLCCPVFHPAAFCTHMSLCRRTRSAQDWTARPPTRLSSRRATLCITVRCASNFLLPTGSV